MSYLTGTVAKFQSANAGTYPNVKDQGVQVAPLPPPPASISVREDAVNTVPACTQIRFQGSDFNVFASPTATTATIQLQPPPESTVDLTQQQQVLLNDARISSVVNVTSLTMQVTNGVYKDRYNKGVYTFGFYLTAATNGASPSFRLNIGTGFNGFGLGWLGWNVQGNYNNNCVPCSHSSNFGMARIRFLSPTVIEVTLVSGNHSQQLWWTHSWAQNG